MQVFFILLVVSGVFVKRHNEEVQKFGVRPIGQGPAGPPVDPAPFTAVWTERQVEFVGIGDSITAGLGASQPALNAFHRLIQNPEDEWPEMQGISLSVVLPNLTHANIAVSGSTSVQHVGMIENRLEPRSPEVFGLVMLTTGGNDLIHSYGRQPPREGAMYGATHEQAQPWIAAFEARLGGMLDAITERFPGGCEIYLADIYDPTDGVGRDVGVLFSPWPDGLAIHAEYDRVLRSVASKRNHVHVVSLHAAFMGHGRRCSDSRESSYVPEDPHYWFSDSGFGVNPEAPNDRGYDAIRRLYLNTIVAQSVLAPR